MANFDELIDILDKIAETETPILSEIEMEQASRHRSVLVRCIVCDAIIYYPYIFARRILLNLLSDPNDDVRAGAACYLEYYPDEYVIDNLTKVFFNDKDPYVRGYCGYALIKHIASNTVRVQEVEYYLSTEKNMFVKNCCYSALYLYCKKKEALGKIVDCFRSKNYRTRCAVANTLMEVLNKDNVLEIMQTVNRLLEEEDVLAVSSALEKLKKKCMKVLAQ